MKSPRRSLAPLALLALLPIGACASGPPGPLAAALPSLSYGTYERGVEGLSAGGQDWFNHGLTLVYGFNHEEAIAAFQKVTVIDPDCPMGWWGIAYSGGIDVNNAAVSPEEERQAAAAAQKALALIGEVTEPAATVEQGLIYAAAARSVAPLPEDRSSLDEEYARRMGVLWQSFPEDADVGALYAESLMNLQPWDYWAADGAPLGRAEEIVAVLEKVLELEPDHPGACHFYIHTVEASQDPGRAMRAAEVLETRVPGSGHLVHMPSHVYIATGQYDAAVRSNLEAIRVDEAYFKENGRPNFYSLYFLHNIHFLSFAAMMEGRSELALEAASKIESEVPEEFLREFPEFADGLMPTLFHVYVRFGMWEEIMDQPEFPAYRHISRSVRRYARAIALANLGRTSEARVELDAFEEEAAAVPETWNIGVNSASVILGISRQVAEGEILFKEGSMDAAFDALDAAQVAEDALLYDEPPGWMMPVRHTRGALLLQAGRLKASEAVYREDLEEWPKNGWSLLGLSQVLKRLGRTGEADAMDAALTEAWSRADVTPPASCYCGG